MAPVCMHVHALQKCMCLYVCTIYSILWANERVQSAHVCATFETIMEVISGLRCILPGRDVFKRQKDYGCT